MLENKIVLYMYPFTLLFELILVLIYVNFSIQYVSFVKEHGLGGFRPNRRIMDYIEWFLYFLGAVSTYEFYLIYKLDIGLLATILAGAFLLPMISIPFLISNTVYYIRG